MAIAVLFLGLVAGTMTTLAGAGGGVLLILSLSLVLGPHTALAVTAPSLLVGNVHRLVLYRRDIDFTVARPLVAGALLGSLVGGAIALSLPSVALRALLVLVTLFAIARAFGVASWTAPRSLLAPAGVVLGGFSATAGGAGLLFSPLLLSSGLSGQAYIATSATIAVATHGGRLIAYGARGLLSREVLTYSALATFAILCGNLLGDRVRRFVESPHRAAFLENIVLAICAAMAVIGFAR
jgi:uncharacterized membrane protein YfcA